MFAILAFVAFTIAAIFAIVGGIVTTGIVLGIVAIGLALLALHTIRPWNPF